MPQLTPKQIYIALGILALIVIIFFVARAEKKKKETGEGKLPAGQEAEIAAMIAKIKSSADWYNAVKAKAAANGVSEDVQLRNDVIWMFQNGTTSPGGYSYVGVV